MATPTRPKAEDLYEEDFYVWTEVQAKMLRERQFEALDLQNLGEEVEALGRAEKSRGLNNANVIAEHLLKLQHSPATEPGTCPYALDQITGDWWPPSGQSDL